MISALENTENELLQRAAQGDHAAFGELFYLYNDKLYSYLLRVTECHQEAEDIIQELFRTLWEGREKLVTVEKFNHYLFRMSKHRAINAFKRKAREKIRKADLIRRTDAADLSGEDLLLLKEIQVKHRQLVEKLPPQQKKVLALRAKGHTHEEIAQFLQLSPATINNHITQALRTLRQHLDNHFDALAPIYCFLSFIEVFE